MLRAHDRLPPRLLAAARRHAGCDITTTNPAAACIWASSKNVLAVLGERPAVDVEQHGVRLRRCRTPAGRMIQASISSVPSVHGTANFSQPSDRPSPCDRRRSSRRRRAIAQLGRRARTVACDDARSCRRRRRSRCTAIAPVGDRVRGARAVGSSSVQVGVAAVLGGGEQRVVVSHTGGPLPDVGANVRSSPVEIQRAHRRRGRSRRPWSSAGTGRGSSCAEERDRARRRATPTAYAYTPVCSVSARMLGVRRRAARRTDRRRGRGPSRRGAARVVTIAGRVGQPADAARAGTRPG